MSKTSTAKAAPRKGRRALTRSLTVTAAAGAPIAASAAPAFAADAPPAGGSTTVATYTLAHDGFCAGRLDVTLNPGGYPGATTYMVGGFLAGIGHCTVDVDVDWVNTATGAKGHSQTTVSAPGTVTSEMTIAQTGSGTFDYTVSTNAANIPAHASGTVPVYQG